MSILRHNRPAGEVDLGHLQRSLDQARLENAQLRERNRALAQDKNHWHGESRRLAGEVTSLTAERDELMAMLHGRTQ